MAWIAVDEDGTEYIFEDEPKIEHYKIANTTMWVTNSNDCYLYVPDGTAEKLTGKPMSWEDEPRELK